MIRLAERYWLRGRRTENPLYVPRAEAELKLTASGATDSSTCKPVSRY